MPELLADGARHVSLVDVLDRVLSKGALVVGDVTIAVADVDLIRLDLQLVLGSIDTLVQRARLVAVPGGKR